MPRHAVINNMKKDGAVSGPLVQVLLDKPVLRNKIRTLFSEIFTFQKLSYSPLKLDLIIIQSTQRPIKRF